MHMINARWLNLEAMAAGLDCVCNIKRNSTWQTTGWPTTMAAGIEVNRPSEAVPIRDLKLEPRVFNKISVYARVQRLPTGGWWLIKDESIFPPNYPHHNDLLKEVVNSPNLSLDANGLGQRPSTLSTTIGDLRRACVSRLPTRLIYPIVLYCRRFIRSGRMIRIPVLGDIGLEICLPCFTTGPGCINCLIGFRHNTDPEKHVCARGKTRVTLTRTHEENL